jgi:hypothetical protein
MRPSFIAGGINGLLMMVVIIMTIMYWGQLDPYQRTILMSLIALLIGLHAILHHIEEIYYHFNPLEGNYGY